MAIGGKRDRRQDLPSCAVMVLLFWIVGFLCASWISATPESCRSCYFGPSLSIPLLVFGGVFLSLSIGAIAIGIAARRHDWRTVSCLGVVILSGIFAVCVFRTGFPPRQPVAPPWPQVAMGSLVILALLPPLTAYMYGSARTRLVLALTVIALTAALAEAIAILAMLQ